MNAVDLIIIAVLAMSVLVGLWRGLISEVLALITWVAAFWVAWTYGPAVSAHFDRTIETPVLRLVIGYGACFIAVLIVGALVRFVLHRLLVTLIVFLVNLTSFAREPMWQQSTLLPQFRGMSSWLEQELPPNVREHLHPGNLPEHLQKLQNSMLPAGLPLHTPNFPAAASSAADATHSH